MADSATLYAAWLQDGSEAQAAAVTATWEQLYRLAYGMVHRQPDAEAVAADCAQKALLKIHRSLGACRDPAAFRGWAAQILRRTVIDELRRPEYARRAALPIDDESASVLPPLSTPDTLADLRSLLAEVIRSGPLSERSRRVVIGRYFAERTDEDLARAESERAGQPVLPSHIQVTRAKNLATLRRDQALVARLRELLEP